MDSTAVAELAGQYKPGAADGFAAFGMLVAVEKLAVDIAQQFVGNKRRREHDGFDAFPLGNVGDLALNGLGERDGEYVAIPFVFNMFEKLNSTKFAVAQHTMNLKITAQGLDGLFEKMRGLARPTTRCPNGSTGSPWSYYRISAQRIAVISVSFPA